MWIYSLAFLLATVTTCSGQTLDGFMYGSSPSKPNEVLKTCQQQAVAKQLQINYTGSHGRHLNTWCSTYDDVIPCVERQLAAVTEPSDWYLKLIFNATRATQVSKIMCSNFAGTPDMSCADRDLLRVSKCMQWTSKSAIDHFMEQFTAGQPLDGEPRRIASIYACIITFTTAGCFQKESIACAGPQRRILNDYYTMLGGKCRTIAGLSQSTSLTETTPEPGSTDVTTMTSQTGNGSSTENTTPAIGRLVSSSIIPGNVSTVTDVPTTLRSVTQSPGRARATTGSPTNGSPVITISLLNGPAVLSLMTFLIYVCS